MNSGTAYLGATVELPILLKTSQSYRNELQVDHGQWWESPVSELQSLHSVSKEL